MPAVGGVEGPSEPAPTSTAASRTPQDDLDRFPLNITALLDEPAVRIVGPGAIAAVRAWFVNMLGSLDLPDHELRIEQTVLVLARHEAARLLPAGVPFPPSVTVLHNEDELRAMVHVAHQRAVRDFDLDTAGRRSNKPPRWRPHLVIVIAPAVQPDTSDELRRLGNGGGTNCYAQQVIYLGGEAEPALHIDADARITTTGTSALPPGATAWTMTESAAADALARRFAEPSPPLPPPLVHASPPQPSGQPRTIDVTLLGPWRIAVGGNEVAFGLRGKALELLALLAVHRDGITNDAAVEALFPDNPERGKGYLRTLVTNLRTVLRFAAGLPDTEPIVERVRSRYRLDHRIFDVDVWRFEDTLAATSDDDPTAATHYQGDFASDEDYTWAAPIRERLRRRAINRLTRATHQQRTAGDLHAALVLAERAVDLDPYDEGLYRIVMDLQHATGQHDTTRRTYRELEQRLAELDLQPDAETARLYG